MVEKSNSGMIQSEIHLWKLILEFDTEFPDEFVLARSDLHVEGNESRVEQKMTADDGNRTQEHGVIGANDCQVSQAPAKVRPRR